MSPWQCPGIHAFFNKRFHLALKTARKNNKVLLPWTWVGFGTMFRVHKFHPRFIEHPVNWTFPGLLIPNCYTSAAIADLLQAIQVTWLLCLPNYCFCVFGVTDLKQLCSSKKYKKSQYSSSAYLSQVSDSNSWSKRIMTASQSAFPEGGKE